MYRFKRGEHEVKSLDEVPWQYIWYLLQSEQVHNHSGLEAACGGRPDEAVLFDSRPQTESQRLQNWRIPTSAKAFPRLVVQTSPSEFQGLVIMESGTRPIQGWGVDSSGQGL